MTYDLIILGGGPAAVAAGVYAARKRLKTLLIAKEFGGQSVVSEDIQNWIGTPHIAGMELARTLKAHVFEYAGESFVIQEGRVGVSVEKKGESFLVKTDDGTEYETRALLVATGAKRRPLTVPGADTFEHKGLTYCASCDGPLFAGTDVVVVGGGNAGFESAAQLLAYAKSVTLLSNGPEFKADKITVDKVLAHPHMKAFVNAETIAILGDKMLSGIRWRDTMTHEEHELAVAGVFVEIGMIPNTDIVSSLVERNAYGKIVVDPRRQRTSCEGIWAAGDCTDGLFSQNNIAVGDAVKALEDIYGFLRG
jgi:alkyl hydroperoxide reductase subunit F